MNLVSYFLSTVYLSHTVHLSADTSLKRCVKIQAVKRMVISVGIVDSLGHGTVYATVNRRHHVANYIRLHLIKVFEVYDFKISEVYDFCKGNKIPAANPYPNRVQIYQISSSRQITSTAISKFRSNNTVSP